MSKKFELSKDGSYGTNLRELEAAVNDILKRLDQIEAPFWGAPSNAKCQCDGDYTGLPHQAYCPKAGRP